MKSAMGQNVEPPLLVFEDLVVLFVGCSIWSMLETCHISALKSAYVASGRTLSRSTCAGGAL